MSLNLDTLKSEIDHYLKSHNFLVFHGFSRRRYNQFQTIWNTAKNQDFQAFLDVAKGLDVKLIVVYTQQFDTDAIDENIETISSTGLEYDEQRTYEKRLRELAVYEGFTCVLELSFVHEGTTYVFELQTEWYAEFMDILEELDESDQDTDEEDPLGGYYSKN
jgi:hypothetical protein